MIVFLRAFNACFGFLMFAFYFYQMVYIAISLFHRRNAAAQEMATRDVSQHRYAVIIPARNESAVIENLIDSLKAQHYPSELIDIFVVADNCTDDTAQRALRAGATVFERHDTIHVGKGYVLDFAFKKILAQYDKGYEAFAVFDADNLVDKYFFREINRTFDAGNRIITSYRNAKNFGDSWVSACSSLWYFRESRLQNTPRSMLNSSCLISGTGYVVAREIIEKAGGWKYHLLTEDIEFTIDMVTHGEKIAFCENAVLYDEQPATFRQSWIQRMRWAKGFYQVFHHYGRKLFQRLLHCPRQEKLSCYDLLMMIMPAMLMTIAALCINVAAILGGAYTSNALLMRYALSMISCTLGNTYVMLFAYGALALFCERKKIDATPGQIFMSMFMYPIFVATYMPISVCALFRAVEWKPTVHTCRRTVSDMTARR